MCVSFVGSCVFYCASSRFFLRFLFDFFAFLFVVLLVFVICMRVSFAGARVFYCASSRFFFCVLRFLFEVFAFLLVVLVVFRNLHACFVCWCVCFLLCVFAFLDFRL